MGDSTESSKEMIYGIVTRIDLVNFLIHNKPDDVADGDGEA